MPTNATSILATVAIVLAIVGIVKPAWPCTAVAVILVSVALLINGK